MKKTLLPLLVSAIVIAIFGVTSPAATATTPKNLVIDSDAGVDDAVAIAWLLEQERIRYEIEGFVTVAGNTTAENAANNILGILNAAGVEETVVIGATEPLVQPASRTGQLVHGPDGFWFTGISNPQDLSSLSTDPVAYYCGLTAQDLTLVALGPLTNVAAALGECPDTMESTFSRVIILGGSIGQGNITPNAEFNIWFDPEAAAIVLDSDLPLEMIPLNTFEELQFDQRDLDRISQHGTALAQYVAPALNLYAQAGAGLEGFESTPIPDVVALAYALAPYIGVSQPALVEVASSDSDRILRGVTTFGLTPEQKIPMIADDAELSALADRAFTDPDFNFEAELGLILMREPDNVDGVLTDIWQRRLRQRILFDLTH